MITKYIYWTLLPTLLFAACSDADADSEAPSGNVNSELYNSYATIVSPLSTKENFLILLDDGMRVVVKENLMPDFRTEYNQRVLINYSYSNADAAVNRDMDPIKLHAIKEVELGEIITVSSVETEGSAIDARIDNSPLLLEQAWFGGKYMNFIYEYPRRYGSAIAHDIFFLHNDKRLRKDTVHVTLFHNAYADVPDDEDRRTNVVRDVISFDVAELVPEGGKGVVLKVNWIEYDETEQSARTEKSAHFTMNINSIFR